MKPVIALDFDGVLNNYCGWKGENQLYEPLPCLEDFLKELNKEYTVIIFTCRTVSKVYTWLEQYGLREYIKVVTETKPKAHIYVDDRALKFEGNYLETLNQINKFKTWWE